MDQRPEIELRLTSDPMYLCGARELVGCIARRIGFCDMDCSKIALAVDEALSNIIRHGYDRAFDKPIWLGLTPIKPSSDAIGGEVRYEKRSPKGMRLMMTKLAPRPSESPRLSENAPSCKVTLNDRSPSRR